VHTHTLLDLKHEEFSPSVRVRARDLITAVKSFHICPVGVRDDHKMHETIFKHVSKVTNDLHYNAMILQQMSAGDMFGGAIDEALCNYNGLVKSDLYCDWRKIFGI